MTDFLFVLLSTALTAFCWGVYGPLMRSGQAGMGGHLLPFICVGIAYFLIAVLVPGVILWTRGEKGKWTVMGSGWSLAAGAAGAIGALGIIMAFNFGGKPIYVMPLVFGGAPVVNTFTTMFMSKTYGEAKPTFYAGLILVIVGATTVLMFKPDAVKPAVPSTSAVAEANPADKTAPASTGIIADATHFIEVTLFTALTALTWGVYGPVLHKGQTKMGGSRLRPFTCVGIAYFLIAVIVPVILLAAGFDKHDGPHTNEHMFTGTMWSLGGGAAGAIGALGIIMAFNFGGKPVFVMPLVFGGAPVINTLATMLTTKNLGTPHPMFYAGLIIVLTGAVTVLIFAPKAPHAPAPKPKPEPKPAAKAAAKS